MDPELKAITNKPVGLLEQLRRPAQRASRCYRTHLRHAGPMLKPGQQLPGFDALDLKGASVSEVAQLYPNQVS